jgi:hypothetical protein
MKSSELVIGKTYGVVPSWSYSSRAARDVNRAQRSSTVKVTLTEMDKFRYEVYRSARQDDINFRKTTETKSFGYRVTDGTNWWIARPQDFITEWNILETRWLSEEEALRKANLEVERQQRAREEAYEAQKTYAEQTKVTAEQNLRRILNRNVIITMNAAREESGTFVSYVTLNVKDLDALMERVLDILEG